MADFTTVADLIEELQNFDPESPVFVAFQPSWPLAAEIANITEVSPDDEDEDWDEEQQEWVPVNEQPDVPNVVWIALTSGVRGDMSPYAPKAAWGED